MATLTEAADVSVIVTPAGQEAGVDELAQVLSARFGAPALRLRIELQRGGAEVARLPRAHAEQVATELRALGFDVHVGSDAGAVRRLGGGDPAGAGSDAPARQTVISDHGEAERTRHAAGPAAAHAHTRVSAAAESASGTLFGLPSKADSFERKIDAMWGPAARGDVAPVVAREAGRGGVPVEPSGAPAPASPPPSSPASPPPFSPAAPPAAPERVAPSAAFDPGLTRLDPAWERVERALAAAGIEPGESSVPADSAPPLPSAAPAPPIPSRGAGAPDAAGEWPARARNDGAADVAPRVEPAAPPAQPKAEPPARQGWAAVLGEDIRGPVREPESESESEYGAGSGAVGAVGADSATVVLPNAPHATPRPGTRGHDALDALAARPPLDAEARYERLKGGVERDERSPALAALWSLLGPGAGQAYNGERSRALTFALAGVLVVPWLVSVVDAVRVARDLSEGRRRGKPQATSLSLGIVAGWWVFVVVAALGVQAVDRLTTPSPIVVAPPTVDSVEGSGVADDAEDPNPGPEVDRGPAERRAEIRRQVDALVFEARAACAAGRCTECVRIAEEALELDESSRAAQQIHVEAVSAVGGGGGCRDVGQRTGD